MNASRFHSPADPVPSLAVFVMAHATGTHTGILHRVKGQLHILDLLWHQKLRAAPVPQNQHHFVSPELEDEEINDIRAMCRLIHRRHEASPLLIPYAFRLGQDVYFDQTSGELILKDGLGLTCSTLVLAIFRSVRVAFIDQRNWVMRCDDIVRYRHYIAMMEQGIPGFAPAADADHIQKLKASLPCDRVRPEEVAAAFLYDRSPLPDFTVVEPGGRWVVAQLN
jgi:hypothetical protein